MFGRESPAPKAGGRPNHAENRRSIRAEKHFISMRLT
jgi:hypothetical protein